MKFVLAVLLLLVALPAHAQIDPKAKTMTTRELWEWAAKKSDVVLLGRVLAPVSDPRPDTNYAAYLGVQSVTARIEPIEWLKGKLDGEEIEVLHNWAVDRSDQRLRAIAGRDTTAAILFLKRRNSSWYLLKLKPPLPPEGPPSNNPSLEWALSAGFVPVSQRHFKSLTEQLHGYFGKVPVAEGQP
jgi:hypothetical protein